MLKMIHPCSGKAPKTCRSQKFKVEHVSIYRDKRRRTYRRHDEFPWFLQILMIFWAFFRLQKGAGSPRDFQRRLLTSKIVWHAYICVCGALNHFWVPYTWKAPHIPRNHTSQYVLKQNHVKNRGFPQLQRRWEAPKRVVDPCGVRGTSQLIQYPRSKLSHVHILFRTEKRLTYV